MITYSTVSDWMGWNLFFPQQCGTAFSSTLCLPLPFPGHSAIPGIPVMLWPLWTNEVSLDYNMNSCQAKVAPGTFWCQPQWEQRQKYSISPWQPLIITHMNTAWVNCTVASGISKIPVTEPGCGQDVDVLMAVYIYAFIHFYPYISFCPCACTCELRYLTASRVWMLQSQIYNCHCCDSRSYWLTI